jgi:hypothetical protein
MSGDDCDRPARPECNVVHIIVGAIVIGVLILLFLWLLPIIGFLFTAALVVAVIIIVALAIVWFIRQLLRGARRYYRRD